MPVRSLPTAAELLEAVADFLRATPHPAGFHVQVASNALAIAEREMRHRDAVDRGIGARLRALLDINGESEILERELCRRIAGGEIATNAPELLRHLWVTVVAELEIDQPGYATLRHLRSTGEHL